MALASTTSPKAAKTARATNAPAGVARVELSTMTDLVSLVEESGIFFGERNFKGRATRATHTHGPLTGMKTEFSFAEYRGKLKLLDGYTRLANFRAGLIPGNPTVLLKTYKCTKRDELTALYDQADSRYSMKTRRDGFDEGLRSQGVDPTEIFSGLLRYGPIPSALPVAYSVPNEGIRTATMKMVDAVRALDGFKLSSRRDRVSAGVMAAMLCILHHCTGDKLKLARRFIEGIHAITFDNAETRADTYIPMYHAFHDQRRDANMVRGRKNVEEVRDWLLGYYVVYCKISKTPSRGRLPKPVPMDTGEFEAWALAA